MASPGWLRRGPGVWLPACALVACALATSAGAAAGEPSLADKETARALFRQGDEHFRAGDYAAALEAFVAADEIMGVPTTGMERGRTLVQLGRLLEGTEVLERVARLPKEPGENEVQERAREEAARLLDKTRPRIPSLLVQVVGVSDQASVRLVVDGVDVPEAARRFPRKVDPGNHEVKVSAQGYRGEMRTVAVPVGQQTDITIALRPFAGSGDPWRETDEEGDGDLGMPLMSWIGFGVAAVGLGIGVGFGAATLGNVSSLEDECGGTTCPADKAGDIDDATTIAHVSTAGFVIAGVGAAVGVLGLLLLTDDEDADDATTVSWAPALGPGFVGVAARW